MESGYKKKMESMEGGLIYCVFIYSNCVFIYCVFISIYYVFIIYSNLLYIYLFQ